MEQPLVTSFVAFFIHFHLGLGLRDHPRNHHGDKFFIHSGDREKAIIGKVDFTGLEILYNDKEWVTLGIV